MKAEFTLTGITPLFMHCDSVEWADAMKAWQSDPKNAGNSVKGDDRSPSWKWLGGLWHDDEKIAVPSAAVQKALAQAGAMTPTGKGRKTFKSQSQSSLIPTQPYFEFEGSKGPISIAELWKLKDEPDFEAHKEAVKEHGFTLDVRRAKVQQSKHIRVRPFFPQWTVRGAFEITDTEIAPHLETIMGVAGERVGIGNWRPSNPSPGPYGMFTTELEIIK